jgi:hypothetical protein
MTPLVLTAAQATVIVNALVDAEQYRRDCDTGWCADCAATPDTGCPDHVSDLGKARAYRDAAAELAHVITNSVGRDVCPPRPASEPLPLPRERSLPMKVVGNSTGLRPDAAEHTRARAIRFFSKCVSSTEQAAVMASIAAEVDGLRPADSPEAATPDGAR